MTPTRLRRYIGRIASILAYAVWCRLARGRPYDPYAQPFGDR